MAIFFKNIAKETNTETTLKFCEQNDEAFKRQTLQFCEQNDEAFVLKEFSNKGQ